MPIVEMVKVHYSSWRSSLSHNEFECNFVGKLVWGEDMAWRLLTTLRQEGDPRGPHGQLKAK